MRKLICSVVAALCLMQTLLAVEPMALETSKKAFNQLALSRADTKNIHYIVKSMGTCNYGTLLMRSKEMNKRGDAIRHVHPLRFLGCILSDRKQKEYFKEIYASKVKWMTFSKSLFANLQKEHSRNNLSVYMPAFAEQVRGDYKELMRCAREENWAGLVKAAL